MPVDVADPVPGEVRAARVIAGGTTTPFSFTVAEPGWTMFMISHFHYDPVWWNTQGAYTCVWTADPPDRNMHGFGLVRAHLEMARREPEYKFVLAEVDYLKPYWDTHPEDRADLRRMIADGRVEIMGGAYNEPNTNLTSAETTIRNFVHGMGFQRTVLGADPATAWQLDVFGHDPQFPGIAADAGLTSSSWARGPHHQWGPISSAGDPRRMQFSSEFEWIAPSGRGLLTHYMPAHYGAGWSLDSAPTLAEAEAAAFKLFTTLKTVALTRNVLLPVGTDYTPPNKWVTDIHRDWNARYTWPRFVCALPREFFAAVRTELDAARSAAVAADPRHEPDLHRQGRVLHRHQAGQPCGGERGARRRAVRGVREPARRRDVPAGRIREGMGAAGLRRAPRRHHRIGVRPGVPRPADRLARRVGARRVRPATTRWRCCPAWWTGRSWCGTPWRTTEPTSSPRGCRSLSAPASGCSTPPTAPKCRRSWSTTDRSVSWLARDVPSLGWRAYRLQAARCCVRLGVVGPATKLPTSTTGCRGPGARRRGVVARRSRGRAQLIADGRVGNELAVYEEYPAHPRSGEGPWHLVPKGPVTCSSACRGGFGAGVPRTAGAADRGARPDR